jgi:hypothetical protein
MGEPPSITKAESKHTLLPAARAWENKVMEADKLSQAADISLGLSSPPPPPCMLRTSVFTLFFLLLFSSFFFFVLLLFFCLFLSTIFI